MAPHKEKQDESSKASGTQSSSARLTPPATPTSTTRPLFDGGTSSRAAQQEPDSRQSGGNGPSFEERTQLNPAGQSTEQNANVQQSQPSDGHGDSFPAAPVGFEHGAQITTTCPLSTASVLSNASVSADASRRYHPYSREKSTPDPQTRPAKNSTSNGFGQPARSALVTPGLQTQPAKSLTFGGFVKPALSSPVITAPSGVVARNAVTSDGSTLSASPVTPGVGMESNVPLKRPRGRPKGVLNGQGKKALEKKRREAEDAEARQIHEDMTQHLHQMRQAEGPSRESRQSQDAQTVFPPQQMQAVSQTSQRQVQTQVSHSQGQQQPSIPLPQHGAAPSPSLSAQPLNPRSFVPPAYWTDNDGPGSGMPPIRSHHLESYLANQMGHENPGFSDHAYDAATRRLLGLQNDIPAGRDPVFFTAPLAPPTENPRGNVAAERTYFSTSSELLGRSLELENEWPPVFNFDDWVQPGDYYENVGNTAAANKTKLE